MANTFGITHTQFAYRFSGNTFSDWSTQIGRWVTMAAAEVAIILRQMGRDSDDVDSAEDLYQICAKFIEAAVTVDIAQAMTRQDPAIAQAARAERDRLIKMIRDYSESLSDDDFTTEDQLGSFRGGGGSRATAIQKPNFWTRGRSW